jgi:adenylate kinase
MKIITSIRKKSMKKLFLIIGAPGSGKTTDAELIAQKYQDITHYSTGDMFRAEVEKGSELGHILDSFMSAGNLVPIDIALKTITNAIKSANTNTVIIDGYPRSVEQMVKLNEYLIDDKDIELIDVIEIVVSEDVACDRVLGRSRGIDDNVEIFNRRMIIYTEPLNDIQDFYKSKNLLTKINGERSIDEIVNDIDILIKSKIKVI